MYFGSCWTLWTRGVLALGVTSLLLSYSASTVAANRHRHNHYLNNQGKQFHHDGHGHGDDEPKVSELPQNFHQQGHVPRDKNRSDWVTFYRRDKLPWSSGWYGGESTRSNLSLGDEDRERFKRYSKYVGYTTSRLTVKQQPMAYVHIKPATSTPTKRKCVRCMVVYKPCKSPPKIVLPVNRYQEPAKKWRGLMYGRFYF